MSLKKNLDVVVFEQLREKIIRGEWTPGQAISADEISDTYGVSRTPVLMALKRMEALNMLTVTTTGHYFVPEYSRREIYDLIEIRALLERQAILDLEEKNVEPDSEKLRELARACAIANDAGDVVNARKADMAFHMFLVSSINNKYLTDLFDRIQSQFMVANYLITGHTQEQQRIAAEEHARIIAALKERNYAAARESMDAHIYAARGKILAKMDGKPG